MAKLILHYPDGASGVALLLLRFSCAAVVFPSLAGAWPTAAHWWPVAVPSVALGLALVVGLGTRAVALLLGVTAFIGFASAGAELAFFVLGSAGSAAALALLGPGAYSVDAHRFGRRVIRLEPRSPNRGSGS